jgi:UDP-glucose 4-epimerase
MRSTPGNHRLIIGCGFLGAHLAAGLARRGEEVVVLSRSFARHLPGPSDRLRLVAGDARDGGLLARILTEVDEVIFCVGGLQPASAETAPLVDRAMIIDPLRVLLTAMIRRSTGTLTFLSSGGAVYGNPCRIPVDEDHPLAPIGAYGAVRAEAERMIIAAAGSGGMSCRILRCANVYGEHQPLSRGQGAVGVFVDLIARGMPVEVYGDGSVVRDFVYVGDLVDAVAQLRGRHDAPAVINVGSGTGTSIRDLIALVEAATDRRAITCFLPSRPFDVREITLDISRLKKLIRYEPMPLAHGVSRLVDHHYSLSPDAERTAVPVP